MRQKLFAQLGGQDKEARVAAAVKLADMSKGEQEAALPVLLEEIEGKRHSAEVVGALERIGPRASAAVPPLTEAFKDADFKMRGDIAGAMAQIDEKAAVPLLLDVVCDPRYAGGTNGGRSLAVQALAALRGDRKEARRLVPLLIDLLSDGSSTRDHDQKLFLAALCVLGEDAKQAVPVLEAIRARWVSVPDKEIWWWHTMWEDARAAEMFFKDRGCEVTGLHDDSGWLSVPLEPLLAAATRAVGPADPADLRKAHGDKRDAVRVGAAFALAKADPSSAKVTVPTFIKVIVESTNAYTRGQAAEALGAIGPDAAEAVTVLSALLNDPDVELRKKALTALAQIKR